MRWFTAGHKGTIRSPKPEKQHKTDIKPVFTRTKSPQAYKRKLFVPIRLIPKPTPPMLKAAMLGIEDDNSPAIFQALYDHASQNGLAVNNIEWVNDSHCEDCVSNGAKISCNDLAAGGCPQTLQEMMVGIRNISHPNCDCHVSVTLSDLSTYIVRTDTASLDLVSDSDTSTYHSPDRGDRNYWQQYNELFNIAPGEGATEGAEGAGEEKKNVWQNY